MTAVPTTKVSIPAVPLSLYLAILLHILFRILRILICIFDALAVKLLPFLPGFTFLEDNAIHLRRILLRHKMRGLDFSRETEFIAVTTQISVDPRFVLRENVQLYCVDKHYAWCLVLPKARDQYLALQAPFARFRYFQDATHLIRMPISLYNSFCDELPEDFTAIFLMTSGRCGTTLLARMLSRAVPQVTVLCCPGSLTQFCFDDEEKQGNQRKLESIRKQRIRNAVKMMLKPDPNSKSRQFIVKLMSFEAKLAPLIREVFADRIKFVFITREPLENILSWRRVMYGSPYFSKLILLMRHQTLVEATLKQLRSFSPFIYAKLRLSLQSILFTSRVQNALSLLDGSPFETSCSLWTDAMCLWEQNRCFYAPFHIVYKDLLADPVGSCSKILDELGVDRACINAQAALQELGTDSQTGTPFSKKLTSEHSKSTLLTEIDKEMLQRMNAFWQAVGLSVNLRL